MKASIIIHWMQERQAQISRVASRQGSNPPQVGEVTIPKNHLQISERHSGNSAPVEQ
jgi:hypothetical protein